MKSVTVYTTHFCPYCSRAKNLLTSKKIAYAEVDITNDDKKRVELERKTGWQTLPMIFIGDEFIGGADDLYALESSGALDAKLR